MITAEAVEAAARAMNPAVWGPQVWTFAAHGETPTDARKRVQQEALQDARLALEAAAPHILAGVLALHSKKLGDYTEHSGHVRSGAHCSHCRDEWPCATIEALEATP